MSAVCSKVRLAPADRKNKITELKKNLLHRSSDNDKLASSMEDESVLQHYNDTVKLVKTNEDSHLKFFLRRAHDPGKIENNFTQAKDALLVLWPKLIKKPEIRSQ